MIKNVCKAEEADLKFIFVDKDFQLLPGPPAGASSGLGTDKSYLGRLEKLNSPGRDVFHSCPFFTCNKQQEVVSTRHVLTSGNHPFGFVGKLSAQRSVGAAHGVTSHGVNSPEYLRYLYLGTIWLHLTFALSHAPLWGDLQKGSELCEQATMKTKWRKHHDAIVEFRRISICFPYLPVLWKINGSCYLALILVRD